MNTVLSALNSIITGKLDYCCLCMNYLDNDAVQIHDEIVVDKTLNSVQIIDILAVILDTETLNSLLNENAICRQCTVSAIKSYNFIKMCKENCRHLKQVISTVADNLRSSDNFYSSCKTLFISLHPTDLSSQLYCDGKKPVTSQKKALKRFKKLLKKKDELNQAYEFDVDVCLTPTIKSDDETDFNFDTVVVKDGIKKPKSKTRAIPTSDMMLDNIDFKCKTCMKIYPSSQHLRQHYFRMHAPKTFKCLKCPRRYGSEGLLEQHKSDSHTPVICIECGKTYQNKHSLKMHELGHKTKIICPDCGRTYKHRRTFNKHIVQNICQQKERKSNVEAKFICDYCDKKFSHKPTLRVHIQFEHGNGKAHVCPWCSKKFYAQSRLKAHIVKHTQEKKFCCELCGGKFVTKESLLYHTRIHTGERPYQCNLCDNRFLSSSRRAEHIRRHHMMPSLECEICHSKFKGRSCLLKHKKRHFNPKSKLHCSE